MEYILIGAGLSVACVLFFNPNFITNHLYHAWYNIPYEEDEVEVDKNEQAHKEIRDKLDKIISQL